MDHSFGIKLPGLVPSYVRTFGELADLVVDLEEIGFDDIVDGEHILFTPSMHNPGGAGNMVHGRSTQLSDRADTIVMFSVFAARTSRIRLVSTNMQVAAHSFGVLAKQASTLDLISGGRFVLGAGGGWHAAQFAAQGIAPAERTARAEETIRACLQLWKPGLAAFHGRWIDFQDMVSEPAPLTPGGPPVWWSGNALTGATARRVVELGSGWIAREAASYDEIASSVGLIQKACIEAGRCPDEVGFRVSAIPTGDWHAWRTRTELFDMMLRNCEKLAGAGITHFTIPVNYLDLDLHELSDLLRALRTI